MFNQSWWGFVMPEYTHLGNTPIAYIAMMLDSGNRKPKPMAYQAHDHGGTASDEYIWYDPPITLARVMKFPALWEAPKP